MPKFRTKEGSIMEIERKWMVKGWLLIMNELPSSRVHSTRLPCG